MDTSYRDYKGDLVEVPGGTLDRLKDILSSSDAMGRTALVTRAGDERALDATSTVRLEDGTEIGPLQVLPRDLPPGYHSIRDETGDRLLVVGPGRCFLPQDLRVWGWAVQLYALWGRDSWGIGDLGDLRTFGGWARSAGASMLLINPLHAHTPVGPVEPSPYYPSSRCFRDPLYIRIADVPGAGRIEIPTRLDVGADRIDRNAVFDAKMGALEELWEAFEGDIAFDAYLSELGEHLRGFATFCVLAETYGAKWTEWPARFRSPVSAEIDHFGRQHRERVLFHAWLQWLLDVQIERASHEIGIVGDLAIGVDPQGADAWWWQNLFATGASIGAPADDYALDGQDWGVAGFNPSALAVDPDPFVQMIRSNLRHCAGLRIDHVMGLFRLFFIPAGMTAREGAYVRFPAELLLEILALESQRAGAYIIGEDLGTVEPGVRTEMFERDMLSYKLLWFLDDSSGLQRLAMASANTHDLPTTAALWSGSDLEMQRAAGAEPNVAFAERIKDRICRHLGIGRDASIAEVVDRSCSLLARSDSAVVTVSIEDALASTVRYNQPGTTGEWNWSATLPLAVDDLIDHPRLTEVAGIMRRDG